MRRRLTAVVLALTLAVSLYSCGAEEKQPLTSTVEETTERTVELVQIEESNTETEQEIIAAEAEPEKEIESLPEQPSEDTDAVTVGERPLVIGTVEGNTYTNGFFGIGCSLDESWTMIPREVLMEASGLAEDVLNEAAEDVSGNVPQMHTSAEMMASSGLMDSIMVTIVASDGNDEENSGFFESGMDYTQANEELNAYFGEMAEAFQAMGLDDFRSEVGECEIAGYNATFMKLSGSYHMEEDGFSMNFSFYEKVVMIQKDSYIFGVVAVSAMEDMCDEYLSYFYSVDTQI